MLDIQNFLQVEPPVLSYTFDGLVVCCGLSQANYAHVQLNQITCAIASLIVQSPGIGTRIIANHTDPRLIFSDPDEVLRVGQEGVPGENILDVLDNPGHFPVITAAIQRILERMRPGP